MRSPSRDDKGSVQLLLRLRGSRNHLTSRDRTHRMQIIRSELVWSVQEGLIFHNVQGTNRRANGSRIMQKGTAMSPSTDVVHVCSLLSSQTRECSLDSCFRLPEVPLLLIELIRVALLKRLQENLIPKAVLILYTGSISVTFIIDN
jgi:hypothetical protein